MGRRHIVTINNYMEYEELIDDFIKDVEDLKSKMVRITGSRMITRGINRSLTRMVSKGKFRYVEMARNLLKGNKGGFSSLKSLGDDGRMCTIESLVVSEKYRILFTDNQIKKAHEHLSMV